MSDLPKAYMKVARDITGYWGTYLPSLALEPGTIGRVVNGVLVKEGNLAQMPGYDAAACAVSAEAERDPVSVWTTQHVSLAVLGAEASAPAGAGSATLQMRFGAANEAAIVCDGNSYRSFANLRAVKDLMLELLEHNYWDRGQCVVTEVLATKAAWICFSTAKDQTAELKVAAPLTPGADPIGLLKAAGGHISAGASFARTQAAGYSTALPSGGTPLFRALKIRREWLRPWRSSPEYLKGAEAAFEEPEFGGD